MMSPPFIGIDFGTTNSAMAWYNPKTGQAEIVRNAEGEEKTPSVVFFGERETLVGTPAERMLEEQPEYVITSVKRHIAQSRRWAVPGRQVTPVEVATEIFKKLKQDAEQLQFHGHVARTVVACPVSFDQDEKDKIQTAAMVAGFDEVVLLDEPIAAALAFAHAGLNVGHHVLVYDLGGGTFDLALLTKDENESAFRVALEPLGRRCGGDDFDRALYEAIENAVGQKWGKENKPGMIDLRILRECRQRKVDLSARERTRFRFQVPGMPPVKVVLKRKAFEKVIRDIVEPTIGHTRSMLEAARIAGYEVDTLVLIGGSSRVPLVEKLLRQTLPIEPKRWQHQDVAVALGTAYHADLLWGYVPVALPARNWTSHAELQYKQAVNAAWADRQFDRSKLGLLIQLAKQLCLERSRAAEIEREIMGDIKEVILARQLLEAAKVKMETNRLVRKASDLDQRIAAPVQFNSGGVAVLTVRRWAAWQVWLFGLLSLGLFYVFYLIPSWSVQVERITGRRKMGFAGVLLLGLFTCGIASAVFECVYAFNLEGHGRKAQTIGRHTSLGLTVLLLNILSLAIGLVPAADIALARIFLWSWFLDILAMWLIQREINLYATVEQA